MQYKTVFLMCNYITSIVKADWSICGPKYIFLNEQTESGNW